MRVSAIKRIDHFYSSYFDFIKKSLHFFLCYLTKERKRGLFYVAVSSGIDGAATGFCTGIAYGMNRNFLGRSFARSGPKKV